MKKTFSLLLCLFILFSFVCVPVQAAEINGFYSYDMTHSAFTFENVNNVLERVDYTDKLTVTKATYLGSSSTNLTLPIDTNANMRYVSSFQIENLNATHEYRLKFKTSCNSLYDVSSTAMGVYLIFYNGNTILKEQELVTVSYDELGWQNVDVNFKPDAQGLGGYNTRIEFRFLTLSKSTVTFRLSEIIEFEDKDDNSSWFEKIINAIKELPSNFINGIRAFFDELFSNLTNLKDNIINSLTNVKDNIVNSLTNLKDNIVSSLTDLGNNIIEGLKNLFIPEEGYFMDKLNYLKDYFEDKFGLFSLPITLSVDVISMYNNVGNSSGIIPVLPIEFFGYRLFPYDEINIRELVLNFNSQLQSKTQNFNLYEFYLTFVDVLILIAFSRLIKRKYNAMFDTGSFDEVIEIYNKRSG